MTIQTDKVIVENGADYTFVCHRIPFAITCSSEFPHGDSNLIDFDLVNKIKDEDSLKKHQGDKNVDTWSRCAGGWSDQTDRAVCSQRTNPRNSSP